MPGLAEKGDITDWLQIEGNTLGRLVNLTHETEEYQPEELKEDAVKTKIDHFKTGKEVLNDELNTNTDWLIRDIWINGSGGFVAGNPKVGKTWFTLGMAISIASGRPFLENYEVPSPGAIMFVEEEANYVNMARRIRSLVRDLAFNEDEQRLFEKNFLLLPQRQIKIASDKVMVQDFITRNDVRFAVFDSLRRFHDANENSSTEMSAVLEAFSDIRIKTGCSITLIHHLHKTTEDKKNRPVFERMRGTSDFYAWADCLIGLQREGDSDDQARVEFQHREAESTPPFIFKRELMPNDSFKLLRDNMDATEGFKEMWAKVREFLQKQTEPVSRNTIVQGLGKNRNRILEVIRWALSKQHISETDKKISLFSGSLDV